MSAREQVTDLLAANPTPSDEVTWGVLVDDIDGERLSPYPHAQGPYFSRVERALNAIPREFHLAALTIFANVIYIPQPTMDDAWRYLWRSFLNYRSHDDAKLGAVHFFEIDPAGFTSRFAHCNLLHGRLDTNIFARVNSVDQMLDQLNFLTSVVEPVSLDAGNVLLQLINKRSWILLTDKALSGQSVSSDLKRLIFVRSLFEDAGFKVPDIYVLIQVLCSEAESWMEDIARDHSDVFFNHALYLGEELRINSPKCRQVKSERLRGDIARLCEWFHDVYVSKDDTCKTMIEQSGKQLTFGYRGCGLTFVDHENCPTASLPLLWFQSGVTSGDVAPYAGPYPRVHSRGTRKVLRKSSDRWRVLEEPSLSTIRERLGDVGGRDA